MCGDISKEKIKERVIKVLDAIREVASVMEGGGGHNHSVFIDMKECVICTEPNSWTMVPDKVGAMKESAISQWPESKKYFDDMSNHDIFHLEEYLINIMIKDIDIFNNLSDIRLEYQERTVELSICRDLNILEFYNTLKEKHGSVNIENRSDRIVILQSREGSFSEGNFYYNICIDCSCEINEGSEVPPNFRLKTPIKLNNNKLNTKIIVTDDGTIEVSGENTIEAIVPIIADGVEEVVIKGTGSLTLECTEEMQPCIGTVTATGMSYGRWSPNGSIPKKIIVDGVKVTCISKVDNFSIGKYGSSAVPQIETRNGGVLICPEAEGERIVTHQAKAPDGSTKISERMEYAIFKEGMLREDMINSAVKVQMKELPLPMHQYVTPKTQLNSISDAVRLCKMNNSLDVSLMLDGDKDCSYARTAALLGNNDIYSSREFTLECNKIDYLIGHFTDSEMINTISNYGNDVVICCMMMSVCKALKTNISEYDYEVLYEMIPSYYFDGWVRGDKKASVEKFIEATPEAIEANLRIGGYIHTARIIKELNL